MCILSASNIFFLKISVIEYVVVLCVVLCNIIFELSTHRVNLFQLLCCRNEIFPLFYLGLKVWHFHLPFWLLKDIWISGSKLQGHYITDSILPRKAIKSISPWIGKRNSNIIDLYRYIYFFNLKTKDDFNIIKRIHFLLKKAEMIFILAV